MHLETSKRLIIWNGGSTFNYVGCLIFLVYVGWGPQNMDNFNLLPYSVILQFNILLHRCQMIKDIENDLI